MADIALPTELLIDGAFVAGEGEPEKVLNPATGEVLVALREASIDQVHKAVTASCGTSRPGGRAGRRRNLASRSRILVSR